MTITLSKELESVVKKRLKSGAYKNTEELVSAGLRLLEAREKGIDALRTEIMRGVNNIKEGRFTTCTSDGDLDELAKTIARDAESESGVLASQ